MIARDIRRVFRMLYAAEMVKKNVALTTRIHQLQLVAVRHGAGGDDRAASRIGQAATESMEKRAKLAFAMLMDSIRSHGAWIDSAAKAELLQMLHDQLQHEIGTLDQITRNPGPVSGPPPASILAETHAKLSEVLARAMRGFEAELDELVRAQTVEPTPPAAPPTETSIDSPGPNGRITAGSGIGARTRHIDQTAKAEIVRALDQVEAELIRDLPDGLEVQAVGELIADTRVEAAKEWPSITKLSAFLFGIGNAIRTSGARQNAYEAMTRATSVIGISLP